MKKIQLFSRDLSIVLSFDQRFCLDETYPGSLKELHMYLRKLNDVKNDLETAFGQRDLVAFFSINKDFYELKVR